MSRAASVIWATSDNLKLSPSTVVRRKLAISSTDANSPIKRTFDEFDDVSILPPGTFRLCAPSADTISITVTPCAAIESGFIAMRIARSRPPNTETLATPLIPVILVDRTSSTYSSTSRASAPRITISTTDSCSGFNFSTIGCSMSSGNSVIKESNLFLISDDLSLTFTPRLNSAITMALFS